MNIKNIVFDIGNVLVKWSPLDIVKKTFTHGNAQKIVEKIFRSETWRALNLGKITEAEAIDQFCLDGEFNQEEMKLLFHHIKATQDPIPGVMELLVNLYERGYALFALTDNVKEIISYLHERYDFWQYFSNVVVSANIGLMKPDPAIFNHLLATCNLLPEQTLFIDDYSANVEAAQSLSINAFQFFDADQCKNKLIDLGVSF